jgi:gamma-glutamylcyclotransferase (GGCT)/AIG2-like uncharacterized protein YtfP
MKYFAYGMNTNLDQMARRCPGAVCLGMAWADDYQFEFRHHADIEKVSGSRVYGVLWDIDKTHRRALDALEGYPYYYTRSYIMVNTGTYLVSAMTYQMVDQIEIAIPGPGYLDMVTEGYQANGVPPSQLDEAINRICSMSLKMIADYPYTWSQTTKDCV